MDKDRTQDPPMDKDRTQHLSMDGNRTPVQPTAKDRTRDEGRGIQASDERSAGTFDQIRVF